MAAEFRKALLEAINIVILRPGKSYTDQYLYGMVKESDTLTQRFGSMLSIYLEVNQQFGIDMINQYQSAKRCEEAILAALVRAELSNVKT